MGEEIIAHGFGGGHEGLADDLAPEQTLSAGNPVVLPSGETERETFQTIIRAEVWQQPDVNYVSVFVKSMILSSINEGETIKELWITAQHWVQNEC